MAFYQDHLSAEQPAVGQLVRELWQTLKLAQEKFAAQLGVRSLAINRWENEHATLSPLAIKQLDILLRQLSKSSDASLRERSQAIRGQYFPLRY